MRHKRCTEIPLAITAKAVKIPSSHAPQVMEKLNLKPHVAPTLQSALGGALGVGIVALVVYLYKPFRDLLSTVFFAKVPFYWVVLIGAFEVAVVVMIRKRWIEADRNLLQANVRLEANENFPGKDIVEAWRDDAINPLISALESEELCLRSERWTWNHYYNAFGGLTEIANQESFSANAEDFISRHSAIGDLLKAHDAALTALNDAGKVLFENAAKSSLLRDVFAAVTSDESLERLKAENLNRINGMTAREIYQELFGIDRSAQERLDFFAECAINGATPTNIDSHLVFWRTYGERFRDAVIHNEYRRNVEQARERVLGIGQSLLARLKRLRKELSERHNIAVEAPRSSSGYSDGGLGLRMKSY